MYIHVLNLLLAVVSEVGLFSLACSRSTGVQQTLESPGDTKIVFFFKKYPFGQIFTYVAQYLSEILNFQSAGVYAPPDRKVLLEARLD